MVSYLDLDVCISKTYILCLVSFHWCGFKIQKRVSLAVVSASLDVELTPFFVAPFIGTDLDSDRRWVTLICIDINFAIMLLTLFQIGESLWSSFYQQKCDVNVPFHSLSMVLILILTGEYFELFKLAKLHYLFCFPSLVLILK